MEGGPWFTRSHTVGPTADVTTAPEQLRKEEVGDLTTFHLVSLFPLAKSCPLGSELPHHQWAPQPLGQPFRNPRALQVHPQPEVAEEAAEGDCALPKRQAGGWRGLSWTPGQFHL